jgi:hypothetical protein
VVSATDPHGRNLGFLDPEPLLFHSSSSSIILTVRISNKSTKCKVLRNESRPNELKYTYIEGEIKHTNICYRPFRKLNFSSHIKIRETAFLHVLTWLSSLFFRYKLRIGRGCLRKIQKRKLGSTKKWKIT